MPEPMFAAILRHGAYAQREGAPSARQPFALTAEGVMQARTGADTLHAMMLEHALTPHPEIFCSRQLRAWQTATAVQTRLRELGHALGDLRETSALAERGLGSAANLTVAEIEAVLAEDPRYDAPPLGWKSDSTYRLPLEGAESLTEAGVRVAQHLREKTVAKAGVLTIHVGHGASFRHACFHLGVLNQQDVANLSMFHGEPLLLCHNGDARWRKRAGSWKVRHSREDAVD